MHIMLNSSILAHQQAFPLNQGILSPHLYEILWLLMALQSENDIRGDLMEIGVLTGATSAFLAQTFSDSERLFLVDPYQDLQAVASSISDFSKVSTDRIYNIPEKSQTVFRRRAFFLDHYLPILRAIHIDGEHSYDAVINDIHLADSYLEEGGIVILDDVFNVASACCTQALFRLIDEIKTLHIVCIGLNKAFLCRSRYLGFYRSFFMSLPATLAQRADLYLRICMNDWSFERGYVSMHEIQLGEPCYQVINHYYTDLSSALAATHYSNSPQRLPQTFDPQR
jgi:predicted O-methyltransferase YrrM